MPNAHRRMDPCPPEPVAAPVGPLAADQGLATAGEAPAVVTLGAPSAPALTVGAAQAALADAARELRAVLERLAQVHARLPPPADLEDRLEDRKPYDVATDVLTTIEGLSRDLLPSAIELLDSAAHVTDVDLAQEHRRRVADRRQIKRTQRLAMRDP
jgi:cobalamin biosynthesis Mg chelatase CobN